MAKTAAEQLDEIDATITKVMEVQELGHDGEITKYPSLAVLHKMRKEVEAKINRGTSRLTRTVGEF